METMACFGGDDDFALSSHALDALKEFYADRDAMKARFEDLKTDAEKRHAETLSIHDFGEDWQASQFWYSDDTANLIARQLLDGATPETTIAAVSAPSVFIALKNAIASWDQESRPKLVLLEYDSRFSIFPEYVFYDYNQSLKLPESLLGAVDRMAIDPPFLNEDCQSKEATTVKALARPSSATSDGARIVICTGERMETLLTTKLYSELGLRTTTFEPEHANKLSNEFYCYANFECDEWEWREKIALAA
ncbi:hypothetical protein MGG_03526 [Pyricularia oryzae 70-15]|uniref:Protein-lysine N-methyltransferase EFM5 n=4 Tax=Pyricularia oryzae TaxID=318829 RepID=G4N7R9_PYRO7|nr:uncharacterized protein MGG_03526 [Pyricularia oryzae 70-15]ADD84630.1 hypothetical protein [Pyricularia oryzae]ELQ36120.1 N-6 adenine-specific DNA methyltransferase 2 [Pyricularia oryzae Y34]EHA50074.1 hypothetical protein MGG_03526 [Pyricularia oryzae 70-15]KAI7927352.1 hypothetical protein M9X92_002333 [Pyricularia oryzae]KAI7927850.1 hypothetical protein M0657_002969 [Pyricularia oryzae]